MKKIKVALIDDHALMREGLGKIIRDQEHMELCGSYASGQELLSGLMDALPDVLLLDIQLPDYSGNHLLRSLVKKYPKLSILALTSMDTMYHLKDMMDHGAMGYLTKQMNAAILIKAIETVASGEKFLLPEDKAKLMDSILISKRVQDKTIPLTQREKEILQLIVEGCTNQEIADKLFISARTIESHRLSLMHKMNAKNSYGLISNALQLGMVELKR